MAMMMPKRKHLFTPYGSSAFYDEMFDSHGNVRFPYSGVFHRFSNMTIEELNNRNHSMQSHMVTQGITFTLNSGSLGDTSLERTIPFDIIPRIITSDEWALLERGLKQRV